MGAVRAVQHTAAHLLPGLSEAVLQVPRVRGLQTRQEQLAHALRVRRRAALLMRGARLQRLCAEERGGRVGGARGGSAGLQLLAEGRGRLLAVAAERSVQLEARQPAQGGSCWYLTRYRTPSQRPATTPPDGPSVHQV